MQLEISNSATKRVAWISILQAIAISAIVIGHIDLAGDMNPEHPIANIIEKLMGFSLEVFFFASGFLYVRSSQFDKPYSSLIFSKFKRLLIPYLFITVVMFVIKLALPSMMGRDVEFGVSYIMKMFLFPWEGPARHVWFLASLFTFFALMPLYKWTLLRNRKESAILVLVLLCVLQQTAGVYISWDFFAIDRSAKYFIYFYLGMCLMKWDLVKYFQKWPVFVVCTLLFVISTFFEFPFKGYWGIGMILSLSYMLAQKKSNLFDSFSKYSYQIYLMHFPPIFLARLIYKKHILPIESIWFTICWILALVLAIYLPVLVSKLFEKLPRQLRLLIGL